MDAAQMCCERIRKSQTALDHAQKWALSTDLLPLIQQMLDDCESLMGQAQDHARHRAYTRQAQDGAAYLMTTWSYALAKLRLLERCYALCPVPTLLAGAVTHAFNRDGRVGEKDPLYRALADSALRLGGIPLAENLQELSFDWYRQEVMPIPSDCKALLENLCEAQGFHFSNEFSTNQFSRLITLMLAKVCDAGEGEWVINYVLRHKDVLETLVPADVRSGFFNPDVAFYHNVFVATNKYAQSERVALALHDYAPKIYQRVTEHPQLANDLLDGLMSRAFVDFSTLPSMNGVSQKILQGAMAEAVFYGHGHPPITFRHFEMFDRIHTHATGKPPAIRTKLAKHPNREETYLEGQAILDAMSSEAGFFKAVEDAGVVIAKRTYTPLMSSAITLLALDKSSAKTLKNPELMSRLSAYFWAVEGQDFLACVDLQKQALTLQDFQAIAITASHGHHLSPRIKDASINLMVNASSRNEIARISYEHFLILKAEAPRLLSEEIIRQIAWKSGKILEEMLQTDLGL